MHHNNRSIVDPAAGAPAYRSPSAIEVQRLTALARALRARTLTRLLRGLARGLARPAVAVAAALARALGTRGTAVSH